MTQSTASCNPFFGRWEEILHDRGGDAAVLDATGAPLRTFGGIEDEANAWAARLRGQSRVILRLDNDPSWPGRLLGIWRAGAAAIPCETALPQEMIHEIAELTGATGIVEKEGFRTLEAAADLRAHPECHLLKITSGTTSQRRAIAFTAGQFYQDVQNLMRVMGITPEDRNFGLIPFAHSYGLSNLPGMLLGGGVPLVVATDAMPRALASALRASGATVLPGVPAMFRGLAAIGAPLSTVRLCISAGAPLTLRDANAFRRATGLKIHSFYGASECGGICYDATEAVEVPEGFVGSPIPGVSVTPDSTESPFRISIRGGAVGAGYLPAREGDALVEGRFSPPDLIESCQGGFRIVGRENDLINIAGRKVNPAEIERALLRHSPIQEVVIFGIPGPGARGESIAACVVTDLSIGRLRALAAESLPAWQIPRLWFPVGAIPTNERGKISRRDLAQRFGS